MFEQRYGRMTGAPRAFPRGMLTAGRFVEWSLSRGVPLGPLRTLHTRGRTTGREHVVPVAVLRSGGQEWLVSPFGDVAWVLNVRANGQAALGRSHRRHPVVLSEVSDDRVPGLLRTYRRRFSAVPFVRAAFDATARDGVDVFAREAARHPVFRVERRGSAPPVAWEDAG